VVDVVAFVVLGIKGMVGAVAFGELGIECGDEGPEVGVLGIGAEEGNHDSGINGCKDKPTFLRLAGSMKAIEKYGIVLRPMQKADLERVRRWRNAPHVVKTMAYREPITPAMQAAWWRGLDPFRNFYWIIEHQGQGIGVVHAKDIDWEAHSAETGIFIGKRDYLQGFVPVLAVLAMMDALFEVHGLEVLRAKVRGGNAAVLDFNLRLGYEVVGEEFVEDEGGFLRLEVGRGRYFEVAGGLREMAGRMGWK
jgi:RimJ/RimL family protein N-acetyltransferase